MKPEEYQERRIELDGWEVNLTSYRLGNVYHCKADNVSPGAWLARSTGKTREEAERQAVEKARRMLSRTRRQTAS